MAPAGKRQGVGLTLEWRTRDEGRFWREGRVIG